MRKQWSKDKVVKSLINFEKSEGKVTSSDLIEKNYALFRAACNHFGSLKEAMKEAGLKYRHLREFSSPWSQDKIKILIEMVAKNIPNAAIANELGLTSAIVKSQKKRLNIKSQSDLDRVSSRDWSLVEINYLRKSLDQSASSIGKKLGRSRAAVLQKRKSLGFEPVIEFKWSREKIINAIKQRLKKGESLKAGYVHTKHKALYRASCRVFGKWSIAVNASGIDYEKNIRSFDYWDKTKISDEIKRLVKISEDISSHAVQKTHRALYQAACHHVGNWEKAILKAGFDYQKYLKQAQPKPISRAEIIAQIQEWSKTGEDLNIGSIGQKFPNFEAQARRKFGNWEKVIRAAGLDYEEIRLEIPESIDCGKKLELILEAFFRKHKPHYLRHPRLVKCGKKCFIPDFYDPEKNIWIDCKLSCWSIGTKETIQKYEKHANEVHIYYLAGKNPKNRGNVRFISIIDLVKKSNEQELLEELLKIVNQAN